jgi:hypothetical protein
VLPFAAAAAANDDDDNAAVTVVAFGADLLHRLAVLAVMTAAALWAVVIAADAAAANVMASGADLLHGLAVLDVVIVASVAALGAVVAAVVAAVADQPRGADLQRTQQTSFWQKRHVGICRRLLCHFLQSRHNRTSQLRSTVLSGWLGTCRLTGGRLLVGSDELAQETLQEQASD